MSSFIVSQKCMNNIINGLFWGHDFKNLYRSVLEKGGYFASEDFQKLGDDFYKLNAKAVGHRYNEVTKPDKFLWIDNSPVNEYQVLKSMQCLRYQCSEGTVVNAKLYRYLEKLIHCYSDYLISKHPDYVKAKWDG